MPAPIAMMFEEPERYVCEGEILGIHEEAGRWTCTVRIYGTDTVLPDKPYLDGRNGPVRESDKVSIIRVGDTYYAYRSLR